MNRALVGTTDTFGIPPEIQAAPERHRVLTGDRPTGRLHVGHYFGSLRERVRLQNIGVETIVLIADYQALTDRDSAAGVAGHVREILLDYLAVGVDPDRATIFTHSAAPALNQLVLPFAGLVSTAELSRNPTVKEEIAAAGRESVSALMFTYPIHQAADILFCDANLVPVGEDQLPHIELTRTIARRFNDRYAPLFRVPEALLSSAPRLLGLDGKTKMGKSRGNSIPLSATADETARLVNGAVTDSTRHITFDPDHRPRVANLLTLASLCTGDAPEAIAKEVDGAHGLKLLVTEAVNEYFAPMRRRRAEHAADDGRALRALRALRDGNARAAAVAERTLDRVRDAMGMRY